MSYTVKLSDTAIKELQKLDKYTSRIIIAWVEKYLQGCDNPRQHGHALKENKKDYWRYRVGKYRLIAKINDDVIEIVIVNIGHRDNVYR